MRKLTKGSGTLMEYIRIMKNAGTLVVLMLTFAIKYGSPDTSEKCIVRVPFCPGMGATNSKFWALRSYTQKNKWHQNGALGAPFGSP